MIIGVPREIQDNEDRVSITPAGALALCHQGHRVLLEQGAGAGSGFSDEDFAQSGAEVIDGPAEIFASAQMILKVKEPQPSEYQSLTNGQILFTFLHLAASGKLTKWLMDKSVTAIGYETVQSPSGDLPLLKPMSEVAGRAAVQIGAHLLERPQGGMGILLGGVPGVAPAEVVIIGGGVVGMNAAEMAIGL
ncbi:MAG: alanine dehydrogenase, partial [Planctomycetes bacterium]|nr:alanine dehydrogenase [Planctomycetota bacterium]